MTENHIAAKCPACRREFRYHLRHRGQRVKCPACPATLRLPVAGPPPLDARAWRVECEDAVFAVLEILALSGRGKNPLACLEILRSLPPGPGALDDAERGLPFARYGIEASRRGDANRFAAALDGFKRIIAMPPARRAMLEACVAGVMTGWANG